MKRIGIDARLISQTGVGRYIQNLLNCLPENGDLVFYIYLLKKDFQQINFNKKKFIKREANYFWHSFSEQIGFLKTILTDSLNLMHFTYFSYPVLYNKKFVATIHDLTPLLFKTGKTSTKGPLIYKFKHFFFRQILSNQIKNSQAIITPSKTVKKQIINHYGKSFEDKIFPIYEGVDSKLTNVEENILLKKKFSKPFFIYVGNFYPHKNIERLIYAFSQIQSNAQLILIGPEDFFSARLLQLINQLKRKEQMLFYHNPTNEDLVFFYKNTIALIHPSLSEGFGLPLIEAAYFSCPIIASNIPVFKEILGQNYLAFDPYNISDVNDKINYFLKKRAKFDYKDTVQKYSFTKMAQETLKIYKRLLS